MTWRINMGKYTKYFFRRTKAAFLSLLVLIVTVAGYIDRPVTAFAEDTVTGTVDAGVTNLRIRSSTDTSNTSNVITKVNAGFKMDILDTVQTSDTYAWYYVGFYLDGTYTKGYVSSEYVTKDSSVSYSEDSDFEAYLDEQGFPESYKDALRQLHEKYPKWIFTADYVGKDWDTVVDNETVLGRSLIYASAISSWKSTQDGAYNWETGSWYELDSGGWVQASKELVQYALDPRNFLNETNIFMFEDLSYNSSVHSESGVASIIDGTFMDGSSHDLSYDGSSYNYASALVYAGKVSGVSPYHLATRIIQEQGRNGTGNSISGTVSGYNGYYNYYNQGAYKTSTASAVVNGLIYASKTDSATLRPWNTRMKSIVGGAIYIGSRYINRGQDTIYYEKFDMVTPYTHQYMTNILAPRSESVTASSAYSETTKKNTALEFKIPVYNNMPSSVCEIPAGDGSPNNALSSLSVSGCSLTPTFSMFTTSYSLIVDNSVSSVEISANAADSSANVSGTGNHALSIGDNTINVTVTSASGDTKTYTIQIVRKEGSSSSDNGSSGGSSTAGFTTDFALDSSTQTISRVGVGSAAQDILNLINFTGGAYGRIYNADGSENNDIVGTGCKLVIYDAGGNAIAQYTFVIYGDVNGDGKITSMDLLYVKRHILGISTLDGVYAMAADANRKNDGITSMDLLYIKRHVLAIQYIEQ
jgi:beta-N-acetylglucosaminidase